MRACGKGVVDVGIGQAGGGGKAVPRGLRSLLSSSQALRRWGEMRF